MNDRDTLTAMLDRAGIVWKRDGENVEIETKTGPKNEGYEGFAVTFTFTAAGALDHTGIYE